MHKLLVVFFTLHFGNTAFAFKSKIFWIAASSETEWKSFGEYARYPTGLAKDKAQRLANDRCRQGATRTSDWKIDNYSVQFPDNENPEKYKKISKVTAYFTCDLLPNECAANCGRGTCSLSCPTKQECISFCKAGWPECQCSRG